MSEAQLTNILRCRKCGHALFYPSVNNRGILKLFCKLCDEENGYGINESKLSLLVYLEEES